MQIILNIVEKAWLQPAWQDGEIDVLVSACSLRPPGSGELFQLADLAIPETFRLEDAPACRMYSRSPDPRFSDRRIYYYYYLSIHFTAPPEGENTPAFLPGCPMVAACQKYVKGEQGAPTVDLGRHQYRLAPGLLYLDQACGHKDGQHRSRFCALVGGGEIPVQVILFWKDSKSLGFQLGPLRWSIYLPDESWKNGAYFGWQLVQEGSSPSELVCQLATCKN